MMCAAQAGQRGRRVLLIDHARRAGEKIRISGGGRCNFTHLHCGPEHFISRNPDFCRSALARYTPLDFVALVERHGIAYHEKTPGQLFCDESSQGLIEMLKIECALGHVAWRLPCGVKSVAFEGGRYRIDTDAGVMQSAALVVATGGLSVPKIGASPLGYRIAEQFGLAIVPPRPALVPLCFDPESWARYGDLSGVSMDAVVTCNGKSFRDSLLFTHRGLSGPVILQISSYWTEGTAIEIDLVPERDVETWLLSRASSQARPDTLLAELLPRRFAQRWCQTHDCARPLCELSKRTLRVLAQSLKSWPLKPSGTLGYSKAEVTLGGVDTAGLSSRTMETLAVPGLYFIGEVVDVTGQLGGFNLQWAWASGHAAGLAV